MDAATFYSVGVIFFIVAGAMLLSISGSLSRIVKSLSKIAKSIETSPGKQPQD